MTECTRPIHLALAANRFEIGGLERCMAALVNGLPKDKVRPYVIAFTGDCSAASWIDRDDVEVVCLDNKWPNDPRLAFRLAATLKRLNIDIIHSHNWGSLVESGIAARLRKIPHVHAEHGLEFSQSSKGLRGKLKPAVKRRFFNKADALVAIANCVRDRFNQVYGIETSAVSLIPNGVPMPHVGQREEQYRLLRKKLNLPKDAMIAGTVGRAAHVKGFDNAIAAFQVTARRSDRFHMVIVGGGPELNRLQALAQKLDLQDRVHLVGHQQDVGAWLAGFDLFFNSSRSEAMNLAIIEAMAVGLPIVATDVGDNAIVIDKTVPCGVVIAPGPSNELGEAIAGLLSDPGRLEKFGSRARHLYQERYTVAKMNEAYLNLYQQTLRSFGRVGNLASAVEMRSDSALDSANQ